MIQLFVLVVLALIAVWFGNRGRGTVAPLAWITFGVVVVSGNGPLAQAARGLGGLAMSGGAGLASLVSGAL
jgi:hypothetical protein